MTDCIFCSIIAGKIPSQKVYEDEYVYAFRDISPQAPVHILIVPKVHIESATNINSDNAYLVSKCFEAITKIAESENLNDGFRVITNSGKDAGQTVFHLHFHLLGGRPFGAGLV
ncbi:MAG: histidine triad nucleotide-binding protein [Oscillospiraceae bacterium]|nr:histidine triad nucleotide-binding protein [Oscillospiraceae bacterium]